MAVVGLDQGTVEELALDFVSANGVMAAVFLHQTGLVPAFAGIGAAGGIEKVPNGYVLFGSYFFDGRDRICSVRILDVVGVAATTLGAAGSLDITAWRRRQQDFGIGNEFPDEAYRPAYVVLEAAAVEFRAERLVCSE